MPSTCSAAVRSSTQSRPPRARYDLPNEVTSAGLVRKRGWRWWFSRRILSVLFVLFRARRHGRLVLEWIQGVPLVVFPEVFHPGLFLSTPLLLDALEDLEPETGSLVLDLGTGTGICAISIALRGARVTATDISPIAVRCARANILINNLEDRVKVLEGDLFEPVERQRFDLVIFNPPYYEGKPRDWAEYAWRGQNVLHRFAEGLGPHLSPKGRAVLSVSTEVDLLALEKQIQESGFEARKIRKRRIPGETIYVYECAPLLRGEATPGAGQE
jgi:release factor glutamine methyltransferase